MAFPGVDKASNHLGISWFDSSWIPHLNKENVLDYFSERSNPFYDRSCNNEIIKMQRLGLEHLENMMGIEYILLHYQDPILYIIRKQKRLSPKQVTTLADYYIIDGTVYQAPDVGSIINARLATTLHHLEAAFSESLSFSRYHPAKGYSWQFKEKEQNENKKPKKAKKEFEPGSIFQVNRVDTLLNALTAKFPHKFVQVRPGERPVAIQDLAPPKSEVKTEKNTAATATNTTAASTVPRSATNASRPVPANIHVKQEKPPPEKRMKFLT